MKQVAAILLALAPALFGQSTRGVLMGNVADPSGAPVGAASVTVTDQARGTTTHVLTNSEGQYTVTNLEPGSYRVSVEAKGFKVASVQDVIINVNQTARIDV